MRLPSPSAIIMIPKSNQEINSLEPRLLTKIMLYVFVATLPLQTIHLPLLNSEAAVSVPRLSGYAFFLAALLDRGVAFRRVPWSAWPIFIFWAWSVMADISEVSIDRSLLMQRGLSWIQSIVMFVIVANLCRTESVRTGLYLTFTCAVGTVGFLQLLGVATSAFGASDDGGIVDQARMSMFGNDANFVGCDYGLAVLLAIAVVAGYARTNVSFRVLAMGLVAPFAFAMASTGSRTAVVATVVGVMGGAFLGLKGRARWIGVLSGGAAIAGFLVLALQSDIVRQRFEAVWYARDSSAREDIYLTAVELIEDNPWKGYGMSNHAYQLGAWDPTLSKTPYRDAHNIVLAALLQAGLIGASIYALGLAGIVWSVWKNRRGKEDFVFFGVICFLLVSNLLLPFDLRKIHWLMLGLLSHQQGGLMLVGFRKDGRGAHGRSVVGIRQAKPSGSAA